MIDLHMWITCSKSTRTVQPVISSICLIHSFHLSLSIPRTVRYMFPPNILDPRPKSKNTKKQHCPDATECDTRMKRTFPQQHAMFQHLNFKKCSADDSFSTFSLPNVLFATAACNFSTSELPKVLSE